MDTGAWAWKDKTVSSPNIEISPGESVIIGRFRLDKNYYLSQIDVSLVTGTNPPSWPSGICELYNETKSSTVYSTNTGITQTPNICVTGGDTITTKLTNSGTDSAKVCATVVLSAPAGTGRVGPTGPSQTGPRGPVGLDGARGSTGADSPSPTNLSTPLVKITGGSEFILSKFNLPSTKNLKILKSSVYDQSGMGWESGALEVSNISDGITAYSSNTGTVQIGTRDVPLASAGPGDQITIRLSNKSATDRKAAGFLDFVIE